MTTPLTHQCTAASLDALSPAYSELHHLAPVQPTEPVPDHNVGAAAGLPLRTMWIQLDTTRTLPPFRDPRLHSVKLGTARKS
jgi:hypothetical protein